MPRHQPTRERRPTLKGFLSMTVIVGLTFLVACASCSNAAGCPRLPIPLPSDRP